MAGGRPLKFKSVKALEKKISEWEKLREGKKLPLTIESLAVYLDCSSQTIYEYGNKEEFSDTISRVREKVRSSLSDSGFDRNINAGHVKMMMQAGDRKRYGDKQEVNQTVTTFDRIMDSPKDESE